jgi:predicted transcriptional regulator
VDFESLPALLAALTRRRLELLDVLGSNPGASIRGLAGRLGRDYKNVHGDVAVLVVLGLIERDAAGRLSAPYDELVIHAPLRIAA